MNETPADSRVEVAQAAWLLSAAAMVLAGGVLLLAGLQLAAFVFIASAIGQALYIYVVAPRYFDVEDPPSAQGRRQTTNAFVLFCAATAFVAWAAWRGRLTPLEAATWVEFADIVVAVNVTPEPAVFSTPSSSTRVPNGTGAELVRLIPESAVTRKSVLDMSNPAATLTSASWATSASVKTRS